VGCELRRINEYGDDDPVAEPSGTPYQRKVARVQRAHGGHQRN
jgi:hypothetical protein